MWGRKKSAGQGAPTGQVEPAVVGGRENGPFEVSERAFEPEEYLDFGSLLIKAIPDIEIQLPTDNDVLTAVLVAHGGSAIELRPFAGSKSAGTWDGVRADLRAEVENKDGKLTEIDGPFGPELMAQFAAAAPDGSAAIQPARFIGVEGPGWVLRATILGEAALESTDEGVLMDIIRQARVRRGDEPRLLRESLPLVLPPDAQRVPDEQG